MFDVTQTVGEQALLLVELFGLPVLFIIFALKGALVGKLFPTSIVLPGYILSVGANYHTATTVLFLVTVAYLFGQYLLYAGTGRYGYTVFSVFPGVDVDSDSESVERLSQWFDRYGGVAVFVTSVIPWTRGLIAVPARLSDYPFRRYAFHTTTATLVSHSLYIFLPLIGLSLLF